MAPKTDQDKKICKISDLMETFGKYQIMQYILICLPSLFITMVTINYVFVVGDTGYRCRIDECEDANSSAKFPSWWPDTNINRCFRPIVKDGREICTNNSFTGELAACNSWIYERNNTVVAELDLACQPWKSNLVGTIHSTGMLLSMLTFGWMSDRFGRRPTFLICSVGGCIGNLKTLATTYYMYVSIEFLEATITGGCYGAAMVLLMEMVGQKYRILSGVVFGYVLNFGETLFVCIAMFVPYWKTLVHIITGPCIFFTINIFVLNESPRWQVVTGRVEKSKKLMKKIAEANNIIIDEEELTNINEAKLKEKFNIERHEVKESYMNVFRSKEIMKRVLVVVVCRFTSSFVYYGLMINSVWLPGDKYQNFLLSSVISYPGGLISLYLMNKVGRKIPLMVGYCASGILCIISALVPSNYLWSKLALFLLGKAIISACFNSTMTYTMELFPTSVRGSLIGLGAFSSRLGGMLAPLTPILNTVSEDLPLAIFGGIVVLAGGLLALMPETKDLPLFDTIKQVENYVKEKNTTKKEESRCWSSRNKYTLR